MISSSPVYSHLYHHSVFECLWCVCVSGGRWDLEAVPLFGIRIRNLHRSRLVSSRGRSFWSLLTVLKGRPPLVRTPTDPSRFWTLLACSTQLCLPLLCAVDATLPTIAFRPPRARSSIVAASRLSPSFFWILPLSGEGRRVAQFALRSECTPVRDSGGFQTTPSCVFW